jgi:hypothetical protein
MNVSFFGYTPPKKRKARPQLVTNRHEDGSLRGVWLYEV